MTADSSVSPPTVSPSTVSPSTEATSSQPLYADSETASDDYARRFAGDAGAWLLAVQERCLEELLTRYPNPPRDLTVLDVGGGHGQIAPMLVAHGYAVTVVGSGPAAQPRLTALVERGACGFDTADLLKLPYPDQAFDIVVCFRLLPHIDAWGELVRELCRVARRGVIIDYPTTQSFNFLTPLLFGAKKRAEGNTRTYRLFRHHEVTREFARNGFRRGGRIGEFFFPMVVHRLLKAPRLSRLLESPPRLLGLDTAFGSPCVFNFFRHER